MIYLKSFKLLSEGKESQIMMEERRTCFSTFYPFGIFRYRNVPELEFEPITIFSGGNGCGKTTILNVIADKLQLIRDSVYNTSSHFDTYVEHCKFELNSSVPKTSRIITSDDVFDYLLDIRNINLGIDNKRENLFEEFEGYNELKWEDYPLKGIEDYENWKRFYDAKTAKSKSKYVKSRLMRNVEEKSNGENALAYFTNSITENALYLLDEPENSLSPQRQLDLKKYIEDSARFFGCQFIISTHSPFLLSINEAKIYDLDAEPPTAKKWTELDNVKLYYNFFKENENEFKEC